MELYKLYKPSKSLGKINEQNSFLLSGCFCSSTRETINIRRKSHDLLGDEKGTAQKKQIKLGSGGQEGRGGGRGVT